MEVGGGSQAVDVLVEGARSNNELSLSTASEASVKIPRPNREEKRKEEKQKLQEEKNEKIRRSSKRSFIKKKQ
jgi:hypothetical protein